MWVLSSFCTFLAPVVLGEVEACLTDRGVGHGHLVRGHLEVTEVLFCF